MVSVYTLKRKEPRVKLNTRVQVAFTGEGHTNLAFETITIDVSPHGACVHLDVPLQLGSVVHFSAKRYAFATRAAVRSVIPDRAGGYVVGLEYLDRMNPIVTWHRAADSSSTVESPSYEDR